MSTASAHAVREQQISFKSYRVHAYAAAEGRDAGLPTFSGHYEVWIPGELEAAWKGKTTSDCESADEALAAALVDARASVRGEMRSRFVHHGRRLDSTSGAPSCEHALDCTHALSQGARFESLSPAEARACPLRSGRRPQSLVRAEQEVLMAF